MADIETLGILQDIESLVADKLQVVSYKWLSRSYLISSDTAKRLLQEFVEKHESGLQVVYALSGWLKNDPPSYHIRLVSDSKLPEAKQDFDGTCSIQVYSVQASIPKDPAALWNAEFVQAEELFKQPFTVGNCLRDNRFCGISNSYVKRSIGEIPASVAAPQPRSAVGAESTKKNESCQNTAIPQPQKSEMHKVNPNVGLQSPPVVKEVKGENNSTGSFHQTSKPIAVKEKVASLPANKKRPQSDKTSSSTEGSLANLWGRVPTKSKLSDNHENVKHATANPTVSSAEAQICAHEGLQSDNSDDDDQNVNIKRTSNESGRKRRVVIDFSDDEDFEDAVSLASPENPKDQSCLDLKQNTELHEEEAHLNNDKQQNGELKMEEEKTCVSKQSLAEEKHQNSSLAVKNEACAHENVSNNREKPIDAAPASPKRRKVLRTRIDERGREVNEVVWEGEEQEQKKDDVSSTKKSDHKAAETTTNRPPPAKKSPALGNSGANAAGKAGAKKAGNATGPKQGNILSFFKKI
ncbi:uncharacterized protein LOC111446774 [Cucurbita moschata]|uniref:DNA polymerase delta subunit 3 n=1 Tax=Cucurbita moschata TaxID=3662 RepID=A0A6J1FMK6_CUCMO|nr:uncharacterized protein LOC111446774 [Cucurbita moschata]